MNIQIRTVLTVLLCAVVWGCSDKSGDAGHSPEGSDAGPVAPSDDVDSTQEITLDWDEPDLPFRVRISVRAHAEKERKDFPLIVALKHPDSFISPQIAVYERVDGENKGPVRASLWAQPGGEEEQVGFSVGGITPKDEIREFFVYYKLRDEPVDWRWDDTGIGAFEALKNDEDDAPYAYRLEGGDFILQREVNPEKQRLLKSNKANHDRWATRTDDWTVSSRISDSYAIDVSGMDPAVTSMPETRISDIKSASDDFAASMSFLLEGDEPVGHQTSLTYRLFEDWPLLEQWITARPTNPEEHISFVNSPVNSRAIYHADDFDRMISDTRGDEAIDTVVDNKMRWFVLYDEQSQRGVGVFIFKKGYLATKPESRLLRYYRAYDATRTPGLHALWMASKDKDEIVDIFESMAPGATVSPVESRDINIIAPEEGEFFFPEEALSLSVRTPGNPEAVRAILRDEAGAEYPIELKRVETGIEWRSKEPFEFGLEHPAGTWTVEVSSADVRRELTLQYRHPEHPKLAFRQDDIAALRAKKDLPGVDKIWRQMLKIAEKTEPPLEDFGTRDIRIYHRAMVNLGLIQLIDPQQEYEELLWQYFFTVLRYPEWKLENPDFTSDLTHGHLLLGLAVIYDWHYDKLTPAERREARDLLYEFTEYWRSATSRLRQYPSVSWKNYHSVTNNHYWINHAGVAAATFALADEIPDDQWQRWFEHLEQDLATIFSVLLEDGTSNEGIPYSRYGQLSLFEWLSFRDFALGTDSVRETPWFLESIEWDLYSTVPGSGYNYDDIACFGDCSPGQNHQPRTVAAWLASRLDNPTAQWVAENLEHASRNKILGWSYLWYEPEIDSVNPDHLPNFRFFPDAGIYIWRSSWENDATYFTMKSGAYFGGHEHPDAAGFHLYRNGTPYLGPLGYSYLKMSRDKNVLLVDGKGQHGEGDRWMKAVDPENWASTREVISDERYFDIIAQPTPMMRSESLTRWDREVVGLGADIFLVHDTIRGDQSMELELLWHSYITEPPTSAGKKRDPKVHREENPWAEPAENRWIIDAQEGAEYLYLGDVSHDSWGASIEPTYFVPNKKFGGGGANTSHDEYQLGYRLRRTRTAKNATSTMAMWFGEDISATSWSTAGAEAARLDKDGSKLAVIAWPKNGELDDFHGVDARAEMVGRRYDEPAYFGRAVTRFKVQQDLLVQASAPVDVFVHLGESAYAQIRSAAQATVSLNLAREPAQVLIDGNSVDFDYSQNMLSMDVPAGGGLVEFIF